MRPRRAAAADQQPTRPYHPPLEASAQHGRRGCRACFRRHARGHVGDRFDAAPGIAPIILAHAVGYVLTAARSHSPGSGAVEVLMPLTLVAAGAPLAGAVLGVFTYRIFNLWLPLIPATLFLRGARQTLAQQNTAGSPI